MASRERKRAERQKRKARTAQRVTERRDEMTARSEAKNEEVRQTLQPLVRGERPGAVTAGAIVCAIIALIFLVSAGVAAFTDVEVNGDEPSVIYLLAVTALVGSMAYGLWLARYWAVLGLQASLVLVMLAAALGLVQVTTVPQAIGTTAVLIGSGTLFYFMIRAMARIQMPERPPHR
jgi:hypothetical protein